MTYKTAYLTVTQNGESKRLKFYGKTKKEAEAKRDKAKWEYENGLMVLSKKTTFKRYADIYLDTYIKQNYDSANYSYLKHLVDKAFGELNNLEIGEIKRTPIQKCLDALAGESTSQMDKAVYLIRGIFRSAVADDIIPRDPTVGLKKPKTVSKTRRALTIDERELFIKALPYVKHSEFFAISYGCGLRPSEVRALMWNDIDFRAHTISVRAAIKKDGSYGQPKSSAGVRNIPIPVWLEDMLRNIPRGVGFVFGGQKPFTIQHTRRIWTSLTNKMHLLGGATTYRNQITIKSPLVGDITPYYLRHTYATSLAEKGVDIKTAQYLLGHSSIEMTARIYTHVTQRMLDTAAEKINASVI